MLEGTAGGRARRVRPHTGRSGILANDMRLRPNPPRLITVGIALVLGVIGFVYLWPVDQLLPLLEPVKSALAGIGMKLDRELAYLFLFACPTLLTIGSLLPGI